jgi:hypothetical protein
MNCQVPDAFIDSLENVLFHLRKDVLRESSFTQADWEFMLRENVAIRDVLRARVMFESGAPLCPAIRVISAERAGCVPAHQAKIDAMLYQGVMCKTVTQMHEREKALPGSPWFASSS